MPADPEGALELPPADTLIAIHAELIARYGGATGVRDPGALEAALARPANLLASGGPGVSIERLAVTVCYSIARIRHPFADGNKRMGFAALVIILEMNGLILDAGEVQAANIMNDVSAGRLSEDALVEWVSANTYPIEEAGPPVADSPRQMGDVSDGA